MSELLIAILTLIGTILIFIQTNRTQRIEHLSEEERSWRSDIRDIIVKLYLSENCNAVRNQLANLRPLLNPLGKLNNKVGTRQAYLVDAHIWLLVREIYQEDDYLVVKDRVEQLTDYLELLLKFDWEESKYKLRYRLFDTFIMGTLIFYALLYCVWLIKPAQSKYPDLVVYIGLVFILISMLIFYLYLREKSYLGVHRYGSNTSTILFLIGYIVPAQFLLERFGSSLVVIFTVIPFLQDIVVSRMSGLLSFLLFFFEVFFLLLSTSLKSKYCDSLVDTEHIYLEKELKSLYVYLKSTSFDNKNLLNFCGKMDKRFRDISLSEDKVFDLKEKIEYIDSHYLWKVSAYKKEVEYLVQYRKVDKLCGT